MNRDAILDQLREIITLNFEIAPALLTPEAQLKGHLGMNSLDLVDLTFFIKRTFGLDAKPQEYHGVQTLGDVAAFIEARLSAEGG